MSEISLNTVKQAIDDAWGMWLDQRPQEFSVKEGQTTIPIIFENRTGKRLDFGIPAIYPMSHTDIAALKEWWEEKDAAARLLAPQEKVKGEFGVNAYVKANMSFNFHITVTAPVKNMVEKVEKSAKPAAKI